MTSKSKTFTTDDGKEVTLTVIKYQSVQSYDVLAQIGGTLLPAIVAGSAGDYAAAANVLFKQATLPQLHTYRKLLLSSAYVVREGEGEKIQLGGEGKNVDNAMNKAFNGVDGGILFAMYFALEVNYANFFAALRAAMLAKAAELQQSKLAATQTEVSSSS